MVTMISYYGNKKCKINTKYLDKGVRNVVTDLNTNGQFTIMSCQGHDGEKLWMGEKNGKDIYEFGRGWILFRGNGFDKDKTLSILKRNGLRRIKIIKPDNRNRILVTFSRIN